MVESFLYLAVNLVKYGNKCFCCAFGNVFFVVKQGLLVVGGRNLFTKRDLPTAEFYLPSNKNWTRMGTPGYKYFNKYFHMIVNFAPDNLSQDDERHESSSVESASSCDWGRGNSEKLDGSHSRD